jgi:rod shape-determining protein MreC
MFFDHKMASFDTMRGYLQSIVSPLQFMANAPKQMITWAADNLVIRQELMTENKAYREKELIYSEQEKQLAIIKQENERLRLLLSSPVRGDIKKMVATILSVDSDPYSQQVVINRGASDGVYEGQPILDAEGIVGQVLLVGARSSRVILITDLTVAVPVRVQRNGIRLTASGSGRIDRLIHNHVSHSADIKEGDLLVTSGLGGKYPEGYPVAKVVYIKTDESREFATIHSQPVAKIDRLRYLLLLSKDEPVSLFSSKKDIEIESNKKNNSEKTGGS